MGATKKIPRIPFSKYLLAYISNEERIRLETAPKCKGGVPHPISKEYWIEDPDDIISCMEPSCNFRFAKGHFSFLPKGTIDVEPK